MEKNFDMKSWIFDVNAFFLLPIFEIPAGELIQGKLLSFKNWVFCFRLADS